MTNILRHRAARFQALYALLIGDTCAKGVIDHDSPVHLSQYLGLDVGTPRMRPISQLGIFVNPAKPQLSQP